MSAEVRILCSLSDGKGDECMRELSQALLAEPFRAQVCHVEKVGLGARHAASVSTTASSRLFEIMYLTP